jgi:hypothetical protein
VPRGANYWPDGGRGSGLKILVLNSRRPYRRFQITAYAVKNRVAIMMGISRTENLNRFIGLMRVNSL